MGRPLNKKYFGNRNTGSISTAADDGIGGKGVASVPVTTAGSYTTTRPTIAFTGAPDLLSGVAPAATITSEVLSAAVSGTQTGTYVVGDLLTITTSGGTATAYVATLTGSAVASVNFTSTGASRGSFQALTAATTTGGSGAGVVLTLTYRAKEVLITDTGSGYTTTVPTTTLTNAGGLVVGTVVMTTPVANTAAAGSATNPEAAIIAYAYTGSNLRQADIVKQVSKDRYKVNTVDTSGTAIIAQLKTSAAANTVGEMTITATDSLSKTYYVKKLTNHKAVIVPYGTNGHEFPLINGEAQQVPWSFSTAVTGTVKIDNG
jgi:hypothetical protein